LDVQNGQKLPDNFIRFAGLVPIDVVEERVYFYGNPTTLRTKYYRRAPHISVMNEAEELPFRLDEQRRLAAIAAIYALNKHEFDVSQDLILVGMGGAVNAQAQQ
jgi:hypothetical protein